MNPNSYLAQLGYERTFSYRSPKEAVSTVQPQPKQPRRVTSALYPSLGLTAVVVYRVLRTLFVAFLLLSIIPVSLAEPHTQSLVHIRTAARTTARTLSRREPASPPERPRTPAPPPSFTTMPGHLARHGSVLHLLRARDLAGGDATDVHARIAERAANTACPPSLNAAAPRAGSGDATAHSARNEQSSPSERSRRQHTFSCLSTPDASLLPAAGSAGTPQPRAGYRSSWASARRGRSAADRGLGEDVAAEEHAETRPENHSTVDHTPAASSPSTAANSGTRLSADGTTHTRTLGVPVPTSLLSRAQLRAAERRVPGGYADGSNSCAYYPCFRGGHLRDPLREPEVVRAELARRARRAGPGLSATGQPVRRVHVFQPLSEAMATHTGGEAGRQQDPTAAFENPPEDTGRNVTDAVDDLPARATRCDVDALRRDPATATVMHHTRVAVYSPMRHRYPLTPSAYPALREGALTLPPMSASVPVPPVAENGESGIRRLLGDTEALIAALKRVAEKQRSADTYAAAVAALERLPPPVSLKEAQARNLARAAAGAAVEVHRLAERAALALADAEKALQDQQELLRGAHAGTRQPDNSGSGSSWRETPLSEATAEAGEVDEVERERGDERSRDRTVAVDKEEPRSTDVLLPHHRRMVVVAVRGPAASVGNREAAAGTVDRHAADADTGKIHAPQAEQDNTTETAGVSTAQATAHSGRHGHPGKHARPWGHHSRRQRYIDRRKERLRQRQQSRHPHPHESLIDDLVHRCRSGDKAPSALRLSWARGAPAESAGERYVRELLQRDHLACERKRPPMTTSSRHGAATADTLVARRCAWVMRVGALSRSGDARSISMGANGGGHADVARRDAATEDAAGMSRDAGEYYYRDATPEEDDDEGYTGSDTDNNYGDYPTHSTGWHAGPAAIDLQGASKAYRSGGDWPASAEDRAGSASASLATGPGEDEWRRIQPRRGRVAAYPRADDSVEVEAARDDTPVMEEPATPVPSMWELLRAARVALAQVARGEGPALQAVGIYGPDRCACGEECTLSEGDEWRCKPRPPSPGDSVDSAARVPETSELTDNRASQPADSRTRTRTLGMRCFPAEEAVDAVLTDTIIADPTTVQRVVNMDADARARAAVPVALLARRRILAAEEGVDLAAVDGDGAAGEGE